MSERTAVLYARVSTEEQAKKYSLPDQIDRLQTYAAAEGFEILAEIEDEGFSGAYMERPGLDRVRDLVAGGGVSVVLTTDRDRFSREPAYRFLLEREFAEHGTQVRSLNDHGDESPEGQLSNAILDQLSKFERAKTMERTRRGLNRKASQGQIIRRPKAPIGFIYSEDGNALLISEPEMGVVRRIFRMAGGEGVSLGEVQRTLNREGVPGPTGGRWHRPSVRNILLSELYRPLPAEEVAPLVSPEIAARLTPEGVYGLWCWNTRRVRKWKERDLDGTIRTRVKNEDRPREEWTVVPVSLEGSGLSRSLADAVREVMNSNLRRRSPSTVASRFWQLSGGIARCDVCGNGYAPHTVHGQGNVRTYYRCYSRYNYGLGVCTNGRHMRAPELEESVWQAVYQIMSDPHRLLASYEERMEREKHAMRGDPDREAKDLAARLDKLERRRSGYLDLAADGDMSRDELRDKLAELNEQRDELREILKEVKGRQHRLQQSRINFAHLDSLLLQMNRIRLAEASPGDRRRIYNILRLQAFVDQDRSVRITGVFDTTGQYLPDALKDGPEWLAPRADTGGIVVTSDNFRHSTS